MAHAKKADGYPQAVAGSAYNGGPEAPQGNKHVKLRPSDVVVDNGNGMDGVWKALVDAGYSVKPATTTKYQELPVFGKLPGTNADAPFGGAG